ncbi:hypothetical protein L0Y49_01220 [bacterium]|nr:hypothetical protein [bacterium]MCI0565992.1 hypothetical protein [bacterium]MCI0679752.1 hypothetical protein [bacterium]
MDFRGFLIIVSTLMFVAIIELALRIKAIRREEWEQLAPLPPEELFESSEEHEWHRVVEHIQSGNPSDWRVAIIEADNLLGKLLDEKGIPGTAIGDRLRALKEGDLRHYHDAWEAHKVRNRIAHESGPQALNFRDAKIAVGRYEKVFRAEGFI